MLDRVGSDQWCRLRIGIGEAIGHAADYVLGGFDAEERLLIDPNSYLVDCFRLARHIWDDGYRPDFLVGLWRGGAPPGIVIQEFFRWKGHDPYHTAIRTQSLEGVLQPADFDIGHELLPRLIGRMHGWPIGGYHRDLGTIEGLAKTQHDALGMGIDVDG